jgi:hypothetical protein
VVRESNASNAGEPCNAMSERRTRRVSDTYGHRHDHVNLGARAANPMQNHCEYGVVRSARVRETTLISP